MLASGVGESSPTGAVDGGDRFRARAGVVAARRDDRCVLLDLNHTHYWGLDETGTRIWELVIEGLPFDRVVERLVEEYDVDRARLEADARRFIDRLLASELLVRI